MAFLDKLSKTLSDTATKVTEASKNIDTKQIQKNLTQTINDTASKVKDTASSIDPKDIPGSLSKMASNAGQAITKHNEERKETQKTAKELLNQRQSQQSGMTVHDAMTVIYLLMSVDRNYTAEEETVFLSAGKEIDTQFDQNKETLITECTSLVKETESGLFEQNIHDAVAKAIWKSSSSPDATISGKLMIWNMIAAAYADGICTNVEHNLIEFAAKELKVEAEVILEMESSMKTLLAVNREEDWLKASTKPYAIVHPQMEELENRKTNIMQGIQALLKD